MDRPSRRQESLGGTRDGRCEQDRGCAQAGGRFGVRSGGRRRRAATKDGVIFEGGYGKRDLASGRKAVIAMSRCARNVLFIVELLAETRRRFFQSKPKPEPERASKARTGKLIRMLASPQDAEVVNAARALQRQLKADGKDLNDLANTLENA